jgi:tRNA(Arg) A34 adenosine deaminase TadA
MKSLKQTHEEFMRLAIQASKDAVDHGNHPFGAVLVKDGKVLMTAENEVVTKQDPTMHAELNLVSMASKALGAEALAGSTMYASTEPCMMCAGAIYWAGITTVVIACPASRLAEIGGRSYSPTGQAVLRESGGVEVIGPVLEEEAVKIHREFIKNLGY